MQRIGICQLRAQIRKFEELGVPIKLLETGLEGLRIVDSAHINQQLSPRGATPTQLAEWVAAFSAGYLRRQ